MNYVYINSEPDLYTVGFYDPSGNWEPESDYQDKEKAANRVAFLNGDRAQAARYLAIVETISQEPGFI